MMQSNRSPQTGSGFSKSIDGIAAVLAIVATFFVAPLFYGASIEAIRTFTFAHYGDAWLGAATLLWMFVSGALVLFIVRALAVVLLIKSGIVALVGR